MELPAHEPNRRFRVVLVDDHQDNLDAFSMLLNEKYDVFSYASPIEAVKAASTVLPDVLVLDIAMRPIDGVQCLRAIRAVAGCADVPAIALTGYAREADRDAFLSAGFQTVVVKPVLAPEDLEAVIDRLAASRSRRSAESRLDDVVSVATSSRRELGETARSEPA